MSGSVDSADTGEGKKNITIRIGNRSRKEERRRIESHESRRWRDIGTPRHRDIETARLQDCKTSRSDGDEDELNGLN